MKQPEPQVGEIWRDKDQRSKGSGEFTVVSVVGDYAVVRRHATKRHARLLVRRMMAGQYIRIGAGR